MKLRDVHLKNSFFIANNRKERKMLKNDLKSDSFIQTLRAPSDEAVSLPK